MNIRKYVVDETQFIEINKPEVAYLLGLIWADGCIVDNDRTKTYEIKLANTLKDAIIFNEIAQKIGKWRFNEYGQLGNRKPIGVISVGNQSLVKFLTQNDYKVKSFESADKILSKIPENLKHYWFRGLIDGDGCLSTGVEISSHYNQNWEFLIQLCQKLNIEYQLKQRINKKNNYKFSSFNIQRIKFANKFGKYIYQNYENDKIGLQRKHIQYLKIKDANEDMQERHLTSGISHKNKNESFHYLNFTVDAERFVEGPFYSIEDAVDRKKEIIYNTQGDVGFEDYYGFKYK